MSATTSPQGDLRSAAADDVQDEERRVAFWRQVRAGVRDHRPDLVDTDRYVSSRQLMTLRGLDIERRLALSGLPVSAQFVPAQDVGMGAVLQRGIGSSLGADGPAAALEVLGGLYNALVGLFDRFLDDFPELFEDFVQVMTPDGLRGVLQAEPLPVPADDEGLPFGQRLLASTANCVNVYGRVAWSLARSSGTQERWLAHAEDFLRIFHRQNETVALGRATLDLTHLPGLEARRDHVGQLRCLAEQRTSWTYHPFVLHGLLDSRADGELAGRRDIPDVLGKVFVLLDDTVDFFDDVRAGIWTTLTLAAVPAALADGSAVLSLPVVAEQVLDGGWVVDAVDEMFTTYAQVVECLQGEGRDPSGLAGAMDAVLVALGAAAESGAEGRQSCVR